MIKLLFFIMARWVSVLTCNSHNPRFVCFSSKIDRINMVMMMVLLFDCCVGASCCSTPLGSSATCSGYFYACASSCCVCRLRCGMFYNAVVAQKVFENVQSKGKRWD